MMGGHFFALSQHNPPRAADNRGANAKLARILFHPTRSHRVIMWCFVSPHTYITEGGRLVRCRTGLTPVTWKSVHSSPTPPYIKHKAPTGAGGLARERVFFRGRRGDNQPSARQGHPFTHIPPDNCLPSPPPHRPHPKQAQAEEGGESIRQVKRPRAIVLVPTRELATQVLEVAKRLSRTCKFASCGVVGGEDYGRQRQRLASTVDMVVATPGEMVVRTVCSMYVLPKCARIWRGICYNFFCVVVAQFQGAWIVVAYS